MIGLPLKYRTENDDYAPLDYEFVGSVSEGQRKREAELLGQGADKAVVRRRAEPVARADSYGTRARQSGVVQPERPQIVDTRRTALPGNPPVRSIAYPEGYEKTPEPEALQEAPALKPPPLPQPPAWEEPPAPAPAAPPQPLQQDEFDAPVAPEIPEWLRTASHNNFPLPDRPPRPQVTPAKPQESVQAVDMLGRPIRGGNAPSREIPPVPQTAEDYQAAGYPPELLAALGGQPREADRPASSRHGAQLAVPRDRFAEGRRAQGVRQANAGMEEQPRRQAYGPREYEPREYEPRDYPPQPSQGQTYAPQVPPLAYAQEYAQPYPQESYPQPGYPPQSHAQPYPQESYPQPGYPPQSHAQPDYLQPPYPQQAYPPESYGAYGDLPLAPADPCANPVARRQRTGPVPNPYVEEPWEEETAPEDAKGIRIPWLGASAAALALIAVLLWIFQMSFAARTEAAIAAREQAQQAVANAHPYSYRELIETQAQRYNIHPAFIAAIVLNESSFRPDAESRVGARGLMQMMQDTAEWVHGKLDGETVFDFDQLYDPTTNLRYSCWYMDYLSGEFRGDPILMAAGFHAGQGEVKNWLANSNYSDDNQTIELENMMDGPTKSYVTKVLRAYAAYKRLYYENPGA